MQCDHEFYCLETDCNQVNRIYCPVCQGGVNVNEIEKPVNKKWSSCNHKKNSCQNCSQKNSHN